MSRRLAALKKRVTFSGCITCCRVGLTLGFSDGPGALELGKSAVLTLGLTYSLKFTIDEKVPTVITNPSHQHMLRFPLPPLSSCASVTDGSTAYLITSPQLL